MVQVQMNDDGDFYFSEEEEAVETLLVLENDADIVLEDDEGNQVPVTWEHGQLEFEDEYESEDTTDEVPGRHRGSTRPPQSSFNGTIDVPSQFSDID